MTLAGLTEPNVCFKSQLLTIHVNRARMAFQATEQDCEKNANGLKEDAT